MNFRASHDKNHKEIADHFALRGASVVDTTYMGGGFPDLLVKYREYMFLVEIKMPGEYLNDRQVKWFNAHKDFGFIVHSKEDVDRLLESMDPLCDIITNVITNLKENDQ